MMPGQQSPFVQAAPVVLPVVFKPLVYCDFRVQSGEYTDVDVRLCAIFACVEIHAMKFCFAHAAEIEAALAGEKGG